MRPRLNVKSFEQLKSLENLRKQGKIINKILASVENKKTTSTDKLMQEIFQPGNINNHCSKRMKVLNSVYQHHVVELMINGKNADSLHKLGLEVTKVRLDNDYKNLNIYWLAKNDEKEDFKIAEILKNLAGEIQHELNTLRLIGKTPHLKFVKDVFEKENLTVQQIFDELYLKGEMTSKSSDIIQISEESMLPQMRHDIFGLHHSDIMRRLNLNIKKCAQGETQFTGFIASKNSGNKAQIPFDKKSFSKFLCKNYILLNKIKNLDISKVSLEDFSEYKGKEETMVDLNDDIYD